MSASGFVPAQFGVVGQVRGDDPRVREVDELRQVADLLAVLDPHVLVLMVEVLVGLREPHARPGALQERDLVATAQEAVAPPDELDASRPRW